MNKEKLLESIKGGIKGELDSINLYSQALQYAQNKDVMEFLENRIKEEQKHYNYLLEYYHQVENDHKLSAVPAELQDQQNEYSPIITDEFLDRIASEQILFSTFSTAALLEKNSMDYYKKCAKEVDEPTLKKFYEKLVDWEATHYEDVLSIQKQAEKAYWRKNRFEPF
jgi:rubrerythrin